SLALNSGQALCPQRLTRHVRRHSGVAIPIAADPRPVPKERLDIAGGAVMLQKRPPHVLMDPRKHLPDGIEQEVHSLIHLIEYRRSLRPHLVRCEKQGNLSIEITQ